MASNINPYNVDGTFPIAGQDNSSQGFRDNFTNIKNNFIFAQNELNDLQSKAIVSSALSGQTITNDMAGTQIRRPQLAAWTQTLLDLGAVSDNALLDFNQANFQKITTAGSITLAFSNWPTSTGTGALGYGLMRVWIVVTDASNTVTLPTSVSIGVQDLAGYDAATNSISFDTAGNYIFDFSSIDGGNNYLIFDVTRNHASFRDPNFYYNDMVNSTVLIGYGSGVQLALALEQGQDKVSALGSYNSVAVGNLSIANVYYTQTDTGPLGGYTVSAARGNIQLGQLAAVHSGDISGYFNGLHYTGVQNTGNAFQNSATIAFYTTGANVAYGLGGNIGFFTAPDGSNGTQYMGQAMSINNDQCVEIMGSFRTDAAIIEHGTIITSLATSGASPIIANTAISTIIIDSINSATIANASIVLPSSPKDKQRIRISTVAPIGNANVYAPLGAAIKYVGYNAFTAGNIAVALTYNSANSTWYRS